MWWEGRTKEMNVEGRRTKEMNVVGRRDKGNECGGKERQRK